MNPNEEWMRFFYTLSTEEQRALIENKFSVRSLATLILACQGRRFNYELDQSPGVIDRLVEEGNYQGFVAPSITDKGFPTTPNEGIRTVKYRTILGEEFKRTDGSVHRSDVEAAFPRYNMRCCTPAEALLPPARDHQLGRGGKPYVAFFRGLGDGVEGFALYVGECEDGGRSLGHGGYYRCGPNYEFVGVCEE